MVSNEVLTGDGVVSNEVLTGDGVVSNEVLMRWIYTMN